MQEGIVLNGNIKLYDELGELARYLETAMRKMSEIGAPMLANSAQLPQASAHLLDLNKAIVRSWRRVWERPLTSWRKTTST